MSRWVARLAALAVVALAVLGLWSAAGGSRASASLDEQTRAVAGTLRCPSCAGESVADSSAPLAAAMRAAASEQLAAGRSPAQVRDWFAQRYGSEVLLDPPPQGSGWLVWLVPLAAAGTAAAVVVRGSGRRRLPAAAAVLVVAALGAGGWLLWSDSGAVPVAEAAPVRADAALELLGRAVAASPGDVDTRLALGHALDDAGRLEEAREQFAAAARLAPLDPSTAYLHAFSLTRTGEPEAAVPVLERALETSPGHPPSLLLLGTLLHGAGDERAPDLLRAFLAAEPEHPAAGQVRGLLEEAG